MISSISPLGAELRLAQLLGDDTLLATSPSVAAAPSPSAPAPARGSQPLTGNAFEDVLNKTMEALEGVSKTEATANQLVEKYAKGQAELQDVMVAQAKMSIVVQLAVTSINSAVNTFKEITQMQV